MYRFRWILFLWMLLVLLAPAHAQLSRSARSRVAIPTPSPSPTPAQPDQGEQKILDKQAEVEKELEVVRRAVEVFPATATSPIRDIKSQQLAQLEKIRDLLSQQILQQRQKIANTQSLADRENELKALKTGVLPEETTFIFMDRLRDELEVEQGKLKTLDDSSAHLQKALADARDNFQSAEKVRRQAKETLDTNRNEGETILLEQSFQVAQLRSRAASEEIFFRQLQVENQALARKIQDLRITLLKNKMAYLEDRVLFTQQQLDEQIANLDKEISILEGRLTSTNLEIRSAEGRWSRVRDQQAQQGETDPLLAAEVEARRLEWESMQREAETLTRRVQILQEMKKTWSRRYSTFRREASEADLLTWYRETQTALRDYDRESSQLSSRLSDLRSDLINLDQEIQSNRETKPEWVTWLEKQKTFLQQTVTHWDDQMAVINLARRLDGKLLSELQVHVDRWSIGEWIAQIWTGVLYLWRYEITSIDDKSITVNKVVTALLLIVMGYYLSRYLTRTLGAQILQKVKLDPGAAAALQSLAFYFLLLCFTLFALSIANFPLTLFTLLGGALAIGVGFGSQNLINNFISGLIILLERPLRPGDLIDLDGSTVRVIKIGPRCTHVKTFTNIDILVPNSKFLDSKVINSTFADNKVRVNINIGVGYDSNPREVTRLIQKTVDEHGLILKEPKPVVFLSDFGDNALIFQVDFWIEMNEKCDRRIIMSDLRQMILKLFREAGIDIAYPQRVVHLKSQDPLEVRMTPVVDPPEQVSSE